MHGNPIFRCCKYMTKIILIRRRVNLKSDVAIWKQKLFGLWKMLLFAFVVFLCFTMKNTRNWTITDPFFPSLFFWVGEVGVLTKHVIWSFLMGINVCQHKTLKLTHSSAVIPFSGLHLWLVIPSSSSLV